MKKDQLKFEHVLEFAKHAITRNDKKRTLTDLQVAILSAAWHNYSYEKIAIEHDYDVGSVKNYSSNLFKELSQFIGRRVTKTGLHEFLEQDLNDKNSFFRTFIISSYGTPPSNNRFRGRVAEIQELESLLELNKCIFITGPSGIGKTSLAVKFLDIQKQKKHFDNYVWYHTTSKNIEIDFKNVLFDIGHEKCNSSFDEFLNVIKKSKDLIVFDEIDEWFGENSITSENILKNLIESSHQSNIIFTCKYIPKSLRNISQNYLGRPVTIFHLEGLSDTDSLRLFEDYDIYVTQESQDLVQRLQGNPLHLHKAAVTIRDSFNGKASSYMEFITSFAGDYIKSELEKINTQLTDVERIVLFSLIQQIQTKPVEKEEFILGLKRQMKNISIAQITQAIDELNDKALIKIETEKETNMKQIFLLKTVRKYFEKGNFKLA